MMCISSLILAPTHLRPLKSLLLLLLLLFSLHISEVTHADGGAL